MAAGGLASKKYVGPRTLERYLNTTGSAYVNNQWRTATVTAVRRQYGRLKLTVTFSDGTPDTEVTLNLWRESAV